LFASSIIAAIRVAVDRVELYAVIAGRFQIADTLSHLFGRVLVWAREIRRKQTSRAGQRVRPPFDRDTRAPSIRPCFADGGNAAGEPQLHHILDRHRLAAASVVGWP
jgi:hypothetical protein